MKQDLPLGLKEKVKELIVNNWEEYCMLPDTTLISLDNDIIKSVHSDYPATIELTLDKALYQWYNRPGHKLFTDLPELKGYMDSKKQEAKIAADDELRKLDLQSKISGLERMKLEEPENADIIDGIIAKFKELKDL